MQLQHAASLTPCARDGRNGGTEFGVEQLWRAIVCICL